MKNEPHHLPLNELLNLIFLVYYQDNKLQFTILIIIKMIQRDVEVKVGLIVRIGLNSYFIEY